MKGKKLFEVISNIETIDDELVVHAKRINGKFQRDSGTVLNPLSEIEPNNFQLPKDLLEGYYYFLEVHILKEFIEGLLENNPKANIKAITDQVIRYAEYDA